MTDTTIEALRAELERQREEQDARHQALLDKLAEQQGEPLTQARASRTMTRGYEQEAARRAGGDGE